MNQIARTGSQLTGRCAAKGAVVLMAVALLTPAGAAPARAGNSWALPLVGGALGGYAISSFVNSRKSEPAPVHHTAPRPGRVRAGARGGAADGGGSAEAVGPAGGGWVYHQSGV